MTSSIKVGISACAAVAALTIGLTGCGSDSSESSSEETSTSETTSESPTTSAAAAKPNYTIVDYIRDNGIVEEPVKRGQPGAPAINLPFPPGWRDAGPATPAWAYGAIVSEDPQWGQDPPSVIALVSKLTGNVDPAKILEFAPGEIKNLPGYEGAQEGEKTELAGFEAVQLGGTYNKNGQRRAIAQKTVVIPGQDALYVLQLNADGREDQMSALMDATSVIDEQTTITP
jgi:hypothetical protein